MAPFPETLVRRADAAGVARLTLVNAAGRNPLSLALIETLRDALAAIGADASLRAIVVDAEGPAFSAGHDLKEIQAHRRDADSGASFYKTLMQACSALMLDIGALPKPVIAAVEGVATAAGCQFVAACDIAIAGEAARFALPGVAIGLFCSTPLVAVGRAIGPKHAMEMAMTGAFYSARDAQRFGLVSRVVGAGEASNEGLAMAGSIAQRSAACIAIGKTTWVAQREMDLAEAYGCAGEAMARNLLDADAAEGIDAFLNRRPPQWRAG